MLAGAAIEGKALRVESLRGTLPNPLAGQLYCRGDYRERFMNVTLRGKMRRYVDEKLKAGRYSTPQDVVHAGLAALMQQEDLEKLSLEELEAIYPNLRAKVAAGLQEAREGKLTDGEPVFAELEREDQERRARKRRGGRKTA
jgi:putative addiction module CopG family antidote